MSVRKRPVLVTGAAGFIGFHTALALLERGETVVGLDNLNDYYSVQLKRDRLKLLVGRDGFSFQEQALEDRSALSNLFERARPDRVVNLAAQAGVRYSIDHPHPYVESNLVGFLNVLEACRQFEVAHLVYASSSSVYWSNQALPFSTCDRVDHPTSLYAATKKANELMAHTYSHLFRLPTTGLRFFTVYGPWGRPDMAVFLFTKALFDGTPIRLFNRGEMERDFTYVGDIVTGIQRTIDRVPDLANLSETHAPGVSPYYRIYNIGNNAPVRLGYLVSLLERLTGREAIKEMCPMQPGDVTATYADIAELERDVGFKPSTSIEVGAERFVNWYRDYYDVS